jgi:3-hydroxybutyryl-CoA dehydrogenase
MSDIFLVGVVGSGIMGGGLAEVSARAGHHVVLRSRTVESARAALDEIAAGLARQVSKGRINADERDAILQRITVTDSIADLADCDLVIESVVEDLLIKRQLFAELDRHVKPSAILATNTSTLPVVDLAMATGRPPLVCGIHFFNPAPVMKLVEVVRPITASNDTIERALEFAERCGKDAIEVRDHAGFVVNALLFPYLNNAVRMLERGTAGLEAIDTAMCGGCGFPMGPMRLLDLVGLDTSVAILDALYAEFKDPAYTPAPTLKRLVEAGYLGRKSGRGFYTY